MEQACDLIGEFGGRDRQCPTMQVAQHHRHASDFPPVYVPPMQPLLPRGNAGGGVERDGMLVLP
jgi:hypothetical protein